MKTKEEWMVSLSCDPVYRCDGELRPEAVTAIQTDARAELLTVIEKCEKALDAYRAAVTSIDVFFVLGGKPTPALIIAGGLDKEALAAMKPITPQVAP